eukprot:scaffold15497_cov117-Cylindrotheca_fusiformis.AAC.10
MMLRSILLLSSTTTVVFFAMTATGFQVSPSIATSKKHTKFAQHASTTTRSFMSTTTVGSTTTTTTSSEEDIDSSILLKRAKICAYDDDECPVDEAQEILTRLQQSTEIESSSNDTDEKERVMSRLQKIASHAAHQSSPSKNMNVTHGDWPLIAFVLCSSLFWMWQGHDIMTTIPSAPIDMTEWNNRVTDYFNTGELPVGYFRNGVL